MALADRERGKSIRMVEDFTASSRAEPGTISFEWSRSTDEPTAYFLIEAFRDAAEHQPLLGCGQTRVYVVVEDEGSSWSGTFGKIESPHGLFLVRSLAAECGTRPGARGWVTWFVLGGQ